MHQQKYWKEIYQLKVHVNYLELYLEKTDFLDRALSIFLAITSSSSIAGWVIWKENAFFWAFIIAAGQVITAIKNFLPYKNRLKYLDGLLHEMEDLSWYAEKKWFDVSEGKLSIEEINELQFDIRKKKNKALKKHFSGNTLPIKKHLLKQAEETTKIYFNNFYQD